LSTSILMRIHLFNLIIPSAARRKAYGPWYRRFHRSPKSRPTIRFVREPPPQHSPDRSAEIALGPAACNVPRSRRRRKGPRPAPSAYTYQSSLAVRGIRPPLRVSKSAFARLAARVVFSIIGATRGAIAPRPSIARKRSPACRAFRLKTRFELNFAGDSSSLVCRSGIVKELSVRQSTERTRARCRRTIALPRRRRPRCWR